MAKYCKPMGLYVTYLDCIDCEEKECTKIKQTNASMEEQLQGKIVSSVQCMEGVNLQKGEKEGMKKVYLLLEPQQKVYIVIESKREGKQDNIIAECICEKAVVYEDQTIYCFEVNKIVTKTKKEIRKELLMCENSNIDTGRRKGVNRFPVFTTKEKCLEWLKQ